MGSSANIRIVTGKYGWVREFKGAHTMQMVTFVYAKLAQTTGAFAHLCSGQQDATGPAIPG